MGYTVTPTKDVSAEVAIFNAPERYYWGVAVQVLSTDPFPRKGVITERVIATAPFPLRERKFEITKLPTYVSGEEAYLLTAQFLPGLQVVHMIDEWEPDPWRIQEGDVTVIFLRRV